MSVSSESVIAFRISTEQSNLAIFRTSNGKLDCVPLRTVETYNRISQDDGSHIGSYNGQAGVNQFKAAMVAEAKKIRLQG